MKTFFDFRNETDSSAELVIYDEIGFWGTTAKDFHSRLKAIGQKALTVHINSPGGNVVDGYAIHNMLRAHKAEVTVYIDGLAGSIASVIAMAGKRVVMPKNTLMFVHMPLTNHAEGNAEELRKIAEQLDKVTEGIVSCYVAKTGKDEKTVRKWMDEETLFTADEAKSAGLADEVVDNITVKACFKAGDYFTNQAILNIFPTAEKSGGANNETQPTNMSKELQDQIAALQAENKKLADSANKSGPEAVAAFKQAEAKRRSDIKAHADKYNKDGDLNDALSAALAADTTVEQFKDTVTEIIAKRVTTAPNKPDGNGGDPENKTLVERYKATKDGSKERAKLLRENRAELIALMRSGEIQ